MGVPPILVFLLVLGILVFVHELGHFMAAKAVGVAVEEFAFGFGPRLVTLFRRSGTEYTIHVLPLGGFVNLVGMQPEEAHLENGLMSKPAWARALVFIAGPLMNVVLALVVLCSMGFLTGLPTPQRSNQVAEVYPKTEAARVGLRTGDRIVALNDRPLTSGDALIQSIEAHPGQSVTLMVERDGKILRLDARPTPELPIVPHVVVHTVEAGKSAAQIGLRAGDQLVAINGTPIRSGLEVEEIIDGPDRSQPFSLTVQRGDQKLTLHSKAPLADLVLDFDPSPLAARLGLRVLDRIDSVDGKKVGSLEDLAQSLHNASGRLVTLTVKRDDAILSLPPQRVSESLAAPDQVRIVGKMGFVPHNVYRKTSLRESISAGCGAFPAFFGNLYNVVASGRLGKSAGSVLTMYRATEMSSKLGVGSLFNLTASLSLSLAVFNLLPIPILDGGHLALLAVEVVRRRRLRPSEYRVANAIGLTVVLVAFVLLMYLDVVKWRAGTPLINS